MPRTGPRPYECVRRAWHSERHKPMRGSLIQEIFRVANEIHSSETKKNKEWLEKLPIVVLKAEEIMYSKANSEAEYVDLKTLWDRANDAINTIIRRDQSFETGVFLQPCIEAALNLGCPASKASRGQRDGNPRCYLSTSVSPKSLENITQGNQITNSPSISQDPNFTKPSNMNLTLPIPQKHDDTSTRFLSLSDKIQPSSNSWSVYPLYYGNELQSQQSRLGFHGMNLDLSLRLASLSVPSCTSTENNWPHEEVEGIGFASKEGGKSSDPTLGIDEDFSFFPKTNSDEPLDFSPSPSPGKQCSKAENANVETEMRKRTAEAFSYPSEDMQFCSTREMGKAGL